MENVIDMFALFESWRVWCSLFNHSNHGMLTAPRIQSGFWAAMGFPVTDPISRRHWYKSHVTHEALSFLSVWSPVLVLPKNNGMKKGMLHYPKMAVFQWKISEFVLVDLKMSWVFTVSPQTEPSKGTTFWSLQNVILGGPILPIRSVSSFQGLPLSTAWLRLLDIISSEMLRSSAFKALCRPRKNCKKKKHAKNIVESFASFEFAMGFFSRAKPKATSYYQFLIHMQMWQLKIQLPRCARTFFMCICRNRKVLWLGGFLQVQRCILHRWFLATFGNGWWRVWFGWTCKVEKYMNIYILFYSTVKIKVFDHWRCIAQIFEKAINRCVCIFPLLL